MIPLGPVVARGRLQAARPAAWAYLADPDRRAEWWPELKLEPAVGGAVSERWTETAGDSSVSRDASGSVDVWVDGHAIGFTWREAGDVRDTAVLLTLRSQGAETGITVTETGFDGLPNSAERAAGSQDGWQVLLRDLSLAVSAAAAAGTLPTTAEAPVGAGAGAGAGAGVGAGAAASPEAETFGGEDAAAGHEAPEGESEGQGTAGEGSAVVGTEATEATEDAEYAEGSEDAMPAGSAGNEGSAAAGGEGAESIDAAEGTETAHSADDAAEGAADTEGSVRVETPEDPEQAAGAEQGDGLGDPVSPEAAATAADTEDSELNDTVRIERLPADYAPSSAAASESATGDAAGPVAEEHESSASGDLDFDALIRGDHLDDESGDPR